MTDSLALVNQDHFDTLVLAGTLDEKRKHIFLRLLAETGSMKVAALAAGYKNTAAIRRAAKNDEAFAAAVEEAAEAASDMLESEAVRRAMSGVRKAIYFKGELIDHEIVYSDSLLALLLKAAKPDKYSERIRNETNVNLRVGIAVLPMAAKSIGDWEKAAISVDSSQRLLAGEKIVDAEFTEVDNSGKLVRG